MIKRIAILLMSLGLYLIVIQKARQQLQALLSLTEEAGKYEN